MTKAGAVPALFISNDVDAPKPDARLKIIFLPVVVRMLFPAS